MPDCPFLPELRRSAGPLRWQSKCEHGICVSGDWGPNTSAELSAFHDLEAERHRLITAGKWPPRNLRIITIGGPWWDDRNEVQGAFHLEELRLVWDSMHDRASADDGG